MPEPGLAHLKGFLAAACHIRARCAAIMALGSFVHRSTSQSADCIGYGTLPFVGGVLVDQCRAGRGVAHPVHQLPKARARVRRELVPGMTKIMKVDQRQARCAKRREPDTGPEAAMWQRPPGRGGEDQALVTRRREGDRVLAQCGHHRIRNDNDPFACLRLGRPEGESPAAHLDELADDADRPGLQVHVTTL